VNCNMTDQNKVKVKLFLCFDGMWGAVGGGLSLSHMWVSGVSFMTGSLQPRLKCLWYPVGCLGPKAGVVLLEKIKYFLPSTGKRTPFLVFRSFV
jgi:hypothetical protein